VSSAAGSRSSTGNKRRYGRAARHGAGPVGGPPDGSAGTSGHVALGRRRRWPGDGHAGARHGWGCDATAKM